ncbi:MAG TPA: DUF935 family protein [Verrucomicrobiae bacterium]|jgi:hypothetical protein
MTKKKEELRRQKEEIRQAAGDQRKTGGSRVSVAAKRLWRDTRLPDQTNSKIAALVPQLEGVISAFGKLSRAEQRQFANALYSDGGGTNPKLANPSKQSRGAYQVPATSGQVSTSKVQHPKFQGSTESRPTTDEEDYFRPGRRGAPPSDYKTEPDESMTPARVTLSVRMRNNPIRGLNFERFVAYLDQWRLGFFRMAGMAWDTMERRDYQLQIVRPKRLKSVARHGYDIILRDDVAESQKELAQAQRSFLNHFYTNLTATNAINPDEEGGFSLLVRQMMDAVGKYYAIHEIVWEPMSARETSNIQHSTSNAEGNAKSGSRGARPSEGMDGENSQEPIADSRRALGEAQDGDERRRTSQRDVPTNALTARFIFCPIWWFEGTRGKLRFLPSEFQVYGNEMLPGDWLVTCGEGLMESCSVIYLMKAMLLKSNMAFLEKFGQPGIHGETDAPKGSVEWNNFVEAVEQFGQEWATVTNRGAKINLIETKAHGDAGFQALLEVFDRAVTQLWRGSDLGTKSRQNAVGASLQEDETEILETDDAKMIEETLDSKVTRYALAWKFGADAPQLAYVKLRTTPRRNIQTDIAVDTFLAGFADKDGKGLLGLQNTLERYARPVLRREEERLAPLQNGEDGEKRESGRRKAETETLSVNGNGVEMYPYNRGEG